MNSLNNEYKNLLEIEQWIELHKDNQKQKIKDKIKLLNDYLTKSAVIIN
jgi:hypothetical protein